MINEMANIASQCVKNPRKPSILVPELGSYICPDSRQGQRVLAETRARRILRAHCRHLCVLILSSSLCSLPPRQDRCFS